MNDSSDYDLWAEIYDSVYSYVQEDIPFYVEEAIRAGGSIAIGLMQQINTIHGVRKNLFKRLETGFRSRALLRNLEHPALRLIDELRRRSSVRRESAAGDFIASVN